MRGDPEDNAACCTQAWKNATSIPMPQSFAVSKWSPLDLWKKWASVLLICVHKDAKETVGLGSSEVKAMIDKDI
jgi:hypothetical protein